jgi:microcystin-dependent protein
MSCSNCYNGCVEIVSDKCVKYTGIDVPVLGIQTGDSLSYVEQALIEFLTSTLNGMGIKPVIDNSIICDLVKDYLPDCGDLTLNDFISALIKAACDLQVQVSAVAADIAVLNANYDVDCLSGVTDTSDTHDVLQAVITKLCDLGVDIAALAIDVDTNYVKIADLDALIAAYLASQPSSTKQYSKMVPYTAVEYYGSLGYFDATGAGLGDWEKIYLCNGLNGTPDKRGRVPVGAIAAVPGGALNPAVNPANPGNPNYSIGGTAGANSITLDATQIPAHTHSTSVVDNHYHLLVGDDVAAGTCSPLTATDPIASNGTCGTNPAYSLSKSSKAAATLGKSSGSQGNINVSVGSTGGGLAHSNIQPVLACYYIIYIP